MDGLRQKSRRAAHMYNIPRAVVSGALPFPALRVPVPDKKRDIRLVIFDCDGVLVDSEIISARILIAQLAKVGVAVDFDYFQRHFLGRSWSKVAAEVRAQYGLTLGSDFEDGYREELLAAFGAELTTTEGVEAVLDQLGVASCVATSSTPRRVTRSLQLSGLAPYFDGRVYTASMVANGKPAPDLFFHAAADMGFAPDQCLVIEDSMPGLLAAINAGMEVWRFTGGSHIDSAEGVEEVQGSRITVFDKWARFFNIAPELRRSSAERVTGDG